MKNEIYPNGCAILSFDDLNYNKIAQDSFKKDLIDWCKADREKWLREDVKAIYDDLYLPTRNDRFENLPDDVRNEYIEKKKVFGIDNNIIKKNALYRYNIERIKMYGSKEKFIEAHGQYAFDRFFCIPEDGSKLDLSWEFIEELMKNGFD